MGFGFFIILLFFWSCLKLRFPDVEENPGPRRIAPMRCRVLFANIRGLHGNLKELAVASSRYDILLCAETQATTRRHSSELLLPGFAKPALISRGGRPNGLGFALYVREGFPASRVPKAECSCCEFMVAKVVGSRQNFYLFGVYRSPSTDDRVYDCLMNSMARIQQEDSRAVFCFVGDFNSHHVEWLGSSRTDSHGVAARDFASLTDCRQLVTGATHQGGGVLDLVLTNVPDLCDVQVGSPIGNSDHSYLSVVLTTNVRAPSFCVSRTVYQKSRINWDNVVSDVMGLSWSDVRRSENCVEALDTALLGIINARVPKVTVRTRRGDYPWFDDECRRAFDDKQEAYHVWLRDRTPVNWQNFRHRQQEAKTVYDLAEQRYFDAAKAKLAGATSSHKWWAIMKESLFGADSSIPPLIAPGGGLVSQPKRKAELLSSHFDSKQSRDTLELPPTCHICPRLSTFAFRSGEVARLLVDLDANGGVDPLGLFPLFLKKTSSVLAPQLSCIFRTLLRTGAFPLVWRRANVTPIPKGPISAFVTEYRPISITPVLSKVFEKVIARRLVRYFETEELLPAEQYAYRKGVGTLDALLSICCRGQAALDRGNEQLLVQIDFSAAFDRVNHAGLLYKLRSAGVGGSLLSVLAQFLSQRTQKVAIDGIFSDSVNVVSGVPQGSVLGPLLFLLYTSDLFSCVENTLVGYADDATLMATVTRPADRIAVAESINRDLIAISNWCRLWGMLLNPSKTKAMLLSRSRTVLPVLPPLVLNGVVVERDSELRVLGVTLDSKLTFELQLRSVASSAARTLGIMRKASKIYQDVSLALKCFWSYVLPILEYGSPVWMGAADSHLALLDRVVSTANSICGGQLSCDLAHRRRVASLCMYYKIRCNARHPVRQLLPVLQVFGRATRRAAAAHEWTVSVPRVRTLQCQRFFVVACSKLWNSLGAGVFVGDGSVGVFKSRANRHLLSIGL